MLKQILLVGVGGAAGSILRFALSAILAKHYTGSFPWATFFVNITGCFLMGILISHVGSGEYGQHQRLFLITGFCGGYTTFSAFSYENMQLIAGGNIMLALGYIFASVLVGLGAVWLGLNL